MICGSICRSAIYNGFLPFFYFHACNKLLSFSVKSCSTKCILILNIRVGWLQSITMALLILYWSKISKLLNFYQKPITMCMIVIGIYGSIEILIDILFASSTTYKNKFVCIINNAAILTTSFCRRFILDNDSSRVYSSNFIKLSIVLLAKAK